MTLSHELAEIMGKLQLSKPTATSNLELVRRDVLGETQPHLNCMD